MADHKLYFRHQKLMALPKNHQWSGRWVIYVI